MLVLYTVHQLRKVSLDGGEGQGIGHDHYSSHHWHGRQWALQIAPHGAFGSEATEISRTFPPSPFLACMRSLLEIEQPGNGEGCGPTRAGSRLALVGHGLAVGLRS